MVVIKLISTLVWGRLFLHSLCKSLLFQNDIKKCVQTSIRLPQTPTLLHLCKPRGGPDQKPLACKEASITLKNTIFFSYGVSGGWMKFFFLFQPTSITQIIIFRNNLWHETSLREIKLLPMNKNKFQPKVNHFSINFSHRDRCL